MVASDGVKYLEGLNPQQKEAVLHTSGPLLIVAGAGAGKTKTITHRIAHLIASGVPPRSILALTFTNKAAGEMRERVGRLLGTPLPTNPFLQGNTPLVTTFHSLGVRILREFADRAGIPRSFSIWDRDDSVRALKRISEVDGGQFPPKQLLARISREKGNSVTAEAFEKRATSFYEEAVAEAWRAYESALLKEGALDFDDLLLRTLALLKNDRGTLQKLQSRWQHLMIDEYQDTNQTQYHIARLIAGDRKSICAVGDVDQCLVGGTPITMADGSKKLIERVQMGDMVRANYGSGDFRPARVSHTQTRLHEGVLIRITTQAGRIIESTPEHIHFAGYRLGLSPQTYFIYLMYKRGKGFRLGVSRVYTRGQIAPMLGFKQRNNHEHADSVWIIDTFETPNKARIAEYTLSLRYRIPTLPFVARKGTSTRGYVHDQHALDSIFSTFDTEKAGAKLLADHGLSRAHPHHHAQSSKRRNNLVVTLCGERRGRTPMHRVSLAASNSESRRTLEKLGYSVRNTTRNPDSWRFETAHKSYGVLCERVRNILGALPDAHLVEMARLGGKKKRLGDGNSLPFMPASSVRKGMALFDEEAGYDIVKHVEHIEHTGTVHDLDIEGVHNFIANGIITHNCLYSWRGADVANLLSFEKTFPGTKVVLLEENYRSTQTILTAANAVIEKNMQRIPKKLFTANPTGEAISLFAGETERDEAFYVARGARELLGSGVAASEIAVLFRENFQSRALEEAFINEGIPYRVLGVRFFDRAEVKDVLSYLRAALNLESSLDFARAAGAPPRGIGKTTLEKVFGGHEAALAPAARAKVSAFRTLLSTIRDALHMRRASESVRFVLAASGIENALMNGSDEDRERLLNVYELVSYASRYDALPPLEAMESVLEDAALMSEQDSLEERREAVSLMTVHASKGLEFDAVFITGLEQGLFPSERESDPPLSPESGGRDPEEERRLFYVALTRARTSLFLTLAGNRARYGSRERTLPSIFLDDIDPRLLSYAHEPFSAEKVIRYT